MKEQQQLKRSQLRCKLLGYYNLVSRLLL